MLRGAAKIGGELIVAGVACIIHAIVPGWFTETAGRTVTRHARAYDPAAGRTPPTPATGLNMKSDRHWPVAIVGAGFSGTMTAAQLARKGIASVLIEGGGRAGLGAAYSTSDPAHLLNVPAGNMSAWPDVPDDFARRAGDPDMFAERRQFGAYLRTILDEKVGSGCTTVIGGQRRSARSGLRAAGRSSWRREHGQRRRLGARNRQPAARPPQGARGRGRAADREPLGAQGARGGYPGRGE